MPDLLDVLRIVTSRLDLAGVPYMVSGSLALGYYAQPRMTRDIDVVVELDHKGIPKVIDAFAADFYCDEDTVRRAVATRPRTCSCRSWCGPARAVPNCSRATPPRLSRRSRLSTGRTCRAGHPCWVSRANSRH